MFVTSMFTVGSTSRTVQFPIVARVRFHLMQSIVSVDRDVPSVLFPSTSIPSRSSFFVPPPLVCLASTLLVQCGLVRLASFFRSQSIRLFGPALEDGYVHQSRIHLSLCGEEWMGFGMTWIPPWISFVRSLPRLVSLTVPHHLTLGLQQGCREGGRERSVRRGG